MKKVIGYILIATFFLIGIAIMIYNIVTAGWYYVGAMVVIGLFAGMALLGFYLIKNNK